MTLDFGLQGVNDGFYLVWRRRIALRMSREEVSSAANGKVRTELPHSEIMVGAEIQGMHIEAKVRFLSEPSSYPDATRSVRVIETHMSWVFVTDRFVYKMKKSVRMPFVDFTRLGDRRFLCEESLRLNRRLAPDVYLRVIALTRDPTGKLELDGTGEPVEWLEMMRRLPEELMLDQAIRCQRVTSEDVSRFTRVLSRFYGHSVPVDISPDRYRERYARDIDANRVALSDVEHAFDVALIDQVARRQLTFVTGSPQLFDARVNAGRILEAHGDLRPEHVCLLDEPVFIDCMEFNREFRTLDTVDELCYLVLECEFLGASFIGPIIFETYEQETGDRAPNELKYFYKSHRAMIRAKLAALHTKDCPSDQHQKWLNRARVYLHLANQYARMLR